MGSSHDEDCRTHWGYCLKQVLTLKKAVGSAAWPWGWASGGRLSPVRDWVSCGEREGARESNL